MRLALIVPTSELDAYGSQSEGVHLALVHQTLKDPKYAAWFKARSAAGDTVILDNGAFENGVPAPLAEIFEAAARIEPTTVVAPDFPMQHWHETRDAFIDFCGVLPRRYKVFGCPQSGGGDAAGYLECMQRIGQIGFESKRLSHIGVSILACPNAFSQLTGTKDVEINRTVAAVCAKDKFAGDEWYEGTLFHYLGLGDRCDLIRNYAKASSLDTASPYRHGRVGRRYEHGFLPGGKSPGHVDFDGPALDPEHPYARYVQMNVDTLKAHARAAEGK